MIRFSIEFGGLFGTNSKIELAAGRKSIRIEPNLFSLGTGILIVLLNLPSVLKFKLISTISVAALIMGLINIFMGLWDFREKRFKIYLDRERTSTERAIDDAQALINQTETLLRET